MSLSNNKKALEGTGIRFKALIYRARCSTRYYPTVPTSCLFLKVAQKLVHLSVKFPPFQIFQLGAGGLNYFED